MIRVLLADDHPFVRRGVREALEDAGGIVVVAEAADGDEALRSARALARSGAVDVVVVDLSMPGLGGIEVVSRLRAEHPETPVLVLSTYGVREVGLQVLDAGGAGYIEKAEPPERLVAAVRRVVGGRRAIGPDLAEALLERDAAGAAALSTRELQVVRAIAEGRTRAAIAATLAVSPVTVSTYRRRALDKLGLRTDAELARYAVREGLVG